MSYSLELFHKGTMVGYILPEALENGTNVVADCKLVIELARGSGMFNIWARKQSPRTEINTFLPGFTCSTLPLSPAASSVMSFKHQALINDTEFTFKKFSILIPTKSSSTAHFLIQNQPIS